MTATVPYRSQMRDRMVAIGSRIITDEGLGALQARRVAQEAQCAVGTLYNVFGGLDYLIIEANALTLEALGAALLRADVEAGGLAAGADARLRALALAYLHFATDHSHAWRALFEHHMASGNNVPAWYRERQGRLFAMVEEILHRTFDDPSDRVMNARALFAAVHGIVSIALDRKLGDFDLAQTERQVRFIAGSVARGLDPNSPVPADVRNT
jgi:AcrR family transcriptional regulator